jgi:hypothetical protein
LNRKKRSRYESKDSPHVYSLNRYPSSLVMVRSAMEENSPLWLALREGGRRVLSLGELSITIPIEYHERWNRLILNMSDALPQRITFPTVTDGEHVIIKDVQNQCVLTNYEKPSSIKTLWLPISTDVVIPLLEQMCSELLLAGYPGCEGCGFRKNEEKWDEELSRKNLSQFSQ